MQQDKIEKHKRLKQVYQAEESLKQRQQNIKLAEQEIELERERLAKINEAAVYKENELREKYHKTNLEKDQLLSMQAYLELLEEEAYRPPTPLVPAPYAAVDSPP